MNNKNEYKAGLTSALLCGFMWGIFPIYWNALKPVDSFTIILYRITLMSILCFIVCWRTMGLKEAYRPMFESRKSFFLYLISGIVITINWSIYILSINSGYVIQTSMGYFLEPLIVCLFGMLFYHEYANKWKKTAMLFAVFGLIIMIVGYREVPVIAVGLGFSFAVYAAIKKLIKINPIQSLLLETTFVMPITLSLILYREFNGLGSLAVDGGSKFFLLMFSGFVTAIPLALFSYAASHLPLVTLGLTDYLSPSLSLIIGIFIFKEPFDVIQFSAFVLIWIGLVFFSYGEVKEQRK